MEKSKLIITAGDPAGIGYEIVCKFLLSNEVQKYNITICAHKYLIDKTFETILKQNKPDNCKIIEPDCNKKFDFIYGKNSADCGKAAISYIDKAYELISKKKVDALITCPINKESIHMAGCIFPGHTEYLAYIAGSKNPSMLLVGKTVKTILTTTHLPLKSAISALTEEKILNAIINAHNAGKYFGNLNPKIALCALNPHAGDGGVLGDEEITLIIPTVEKARQMGYDVYGPYPSDTIFVNAKKWDFIISCYHDQGMIAVKMDSFGEAVNVTLNLPFIRTSVDHGTAFDIAGRNLASFSSLAKAVELADIMVKYDKSFSSI